MIRKFAGPLRNLFGCARLYRQVRRIRYTEHRRGTIVFNTVGCFLFNVHTDFFLGHLLARAGFTVKLMVDDHTLVHWEYLQRTRSDDDYRRHHFRRVRAMLRLYAWLSARIFRHPNLEVIPYSRALAAVADNVAVDDSHRAHADSSVRRYFQAGEVRLDEPAHREYYEASLKNCVISTRIGLYIHQVLRPDLFVTSHGIYSTWGPCYDLLKQLGYRCLVWGVDYYQERHIQVVDAIMPTISEASSWQQAGERPLTPAQGELVKTFFENRIAGRAIDTVVLHRHVDRSGRLAVRRPERARTTFGLFGNVIWDNDIVRRNTVFSGPVDWIVATIRHIQSGPDHLILRFHPSEATLFPMSVKLESMIRQRVPDLDAIANVTIVSSGQKIDVYQLVRESIDVGLVYDSMLGLEMAHFGVPVICAARARYYGAGIAVEPRTRQEYFDLLDAGAAVSPPARREDSRRRAYRFTYWYSREVSYQMPLFRRQGYSDINFDASVEELDPERNPELLRTVHAFADFADARPAARPHAVSA